MPASPNPARRSSRRPLLRVFGFFVALLAGFALWEASAARLPLDVNSLTVFSDDVDIDIPLVNDHFEGPPGTGLDGSPAPGGGVWEADGSWQYAGSSAVRVGNNSGNSIAVVNLGKSDHLVLETEIHNAGQHPTSNGVGIMLFNNGAGRGFAALYDPRDNQARIDLITNNAQTRASQGGVGSSQTVVVRVVVDKPTITMFLDGVEVLSYDMTPTELADWGSNTRFGMIAIKDKDAQFDYFWVEDL